MRHVPRPPALQRINGTGDRTRRATGGPRPAPILWLLALLTAALVLSGCSAVRVDDYAAQTPRLDLKQYFDGRLVAHGIVQDRSGRVIRRMVVDLVGRWDGDTGTLEEDFTYSDGTTERRVWTIRKQGDRYTGTAADVVGTAIGEAAGNALNWRYVLAYPADGRTWNLDFDDWMWLVNERTLVNRAVFSKFGIRLGEVIITFDKRP